MALKLKKETKRRLWLFGAVLVLGVIVLLAEHNNRGAVGSGPVAAPQPSCTMKVTETLNVRSGPGTDNPVVQTLASGAEVTADRVTRRGFRQLGPDRWAAQEYLIPTPGSDCG